jgi:Fe2+ or Zn2+ uptake regulation protein
MKNKNLLKTALRSTERYSDSQYRVFDLLVDIANDSEVSASVKFIIDRTKLTMPTVYTALKALQKDDIIIKSPSANNTYKFNQGKLEEITELYNNKKSI